MESCGNLTLNTTYQPITEGIPSTCKATGLTWAGLSVPSRWWYRCRGCLQYLPLFPMKLLWSSIMLLPLTLLPTKHPAATKGPCQAVATHLPRDAECSGHWVFAMLIPSLSWVSPVPPPCPTFRYIITPSRPAQCRS